jgi:hypothetical protein
MGPKDAALRKEWMASYHSALGGGDGQAKAGFHQESAITASKTGLLARLKADLGPSLARAADTGVAQSTTPARYKSSNSSNILGATDFVADVMDSFPFSMATAAASDALALSTTASKQIENVERKIESFPIIKLLNLEKEKPHVIEKTPLVKRFPLKRDWLVMASRTLLLEPVSFYHSECMLIRI